VGERRLWLSVEKNREYSKVFETTIFDSDASGKSGIF